MAELVTLALVLAGMLLVVVAFGAVLGGIGALSGGRIERCDACHRFGLVGKGQVHPDGCPEPHPSWSRAQGLVGEIHLRHH